MAEDIVALLKGNHQTILPLIDPEKEPFMLDFDRIILQLSALDVKQFLVGGSSNITSEDCGRTIERIKKLVPDNQGIIQFPGSPQHINSQSDAILFLSMLSAGDLKHIITNQLIATDIINDLEINQDSSPAIIPTAYILVDGGKSTTVMDVSKVSPIGNNESHEALRYALLAKNMGFKVVYFDTGSNPNKHASVEMIDTVCTHPSLKKSEILIFVGGGITERNQFEAMQKSGVNKIVVGTFFERNPSNEEISMLVRG
jgi:putative glycerol-1-phosphate prenyltransferase